jgi:hypothetical protein
MELPEPKRIFELTEDNFIIFLEYFSEKIKAENQVLDEFIPESEALKLLGIKSKTSLFKLRSNGKISYSKMGKIIMYRRTSIMEYIIENEQSKF